MLQAKALRHCCGAFRTSPITVLLIEMGEMPLSIRCIKLGLQYWTKVSGSSQTFAVRCLLQEVEGINRYESFMSTFTQWTRKLGMRQEAIAGHTSWSLTPPWVIPALNIELSFLQEEDKREVRMSVEEYLRAARGDKTFIFTDRSRDPVSQRAGFGIYIEQPELKFSVRVSDEISVFTTELMAILWALKWVKGDKPKEVVTCSDSAAALEALRAGKSKARPDLSIHPSIHF